jgi:hypothetical protein
MPCLEMAGCRGVKVGGYGGRERKSRNQIARCDENLWELSTASTLRLLVHIMGRAPALLTFNALQYPLTRLCFDVNPNSSLDTMTTYADPPLTRQHITELFNTHKPFL